MKKISLCILCFAAISCSQVPDQKSPDTSVVLVFIDPTTGNQTEKRFASKDEAKKYIEDRLTSNTN
jgi:guanylate kinase